MCSWSWAGRRQAGGEAPGTLPPGRGVLPPPGSRGQGGSSGGGTGRTPAAQRPGRPGQVGGLGSAKTSGGRHRARWSGKAAGSWARRPPPSPELTAAAPNCRQHPVGRCQWPVPRGRHVPPARWSVACRPHEGDGRAAGPPLQSAPCAHVGRRNQEDESWWAPPPPCARHLISGAVAAPARRGGLSDGRLCPPRRPRHGSPPARPGLR